MLLCVLAAPRALRHALLAEPAVHNATLELGAQEPTQNATAPAPEQVALHAAADDESVGLEGRRRSSSSSKSSSSSSRRRDDGRRRAPKTEKTEVHIHYGDDGRRRDGRRRSNFPGCDSECYDWMQIDG